MTFPTFLTPGVAIATAAIAAPLLLLLYFLKLRRQSVRISSTLLWKKAVQDLQVNAPFQKLRRNLLLFLQLIVLALAIFAIATPLSRWAARTSNKIILMIDQSASMNTVEAGGKTRLELAKQAAIDYVRALREKDQVMVISFADRARATPFTSDRGQIERQIDAIEPSDGPSRLSEALQLAQAHANPSRLLEEPGLAPPVGSDAQIELFSDGRISDADEQIVQRGRMRYFQIGQADDNAGITELTVRRGYEQPDLLTVYSRVSNFGRESVACDVSLSIDGALQRTEKIALGPRQPEGLPVQDAAQSPDQEVVFEVEHGGAGLVELALHRDDALAVDNKARALVDPPRPLNVLGVCDRQAVKEFWLANVLRQMPVNRVDWMSTDEYESAPDSALVQDGRPVYDIVAFDNHSTAKLHPGAYIFFGGIPKIEGVAIGDEMIEDEYVSYWDDTHPILRYVNFDHANVARWRRLTLPPYATPLAEGERSVLMAHVAVPGRQFVIMGFDLLDTNWPRDLSFVVFMYNTTRYLSGNSGETGAMFRPGDTVIGPPMAGSEIRVVRPDHDSDKVASGASQRPTYARTHQVGVYRMESDHDESVYRFAVNLLNSNESHVAPRQVLSVGAEQVARADTEARINQPLWPWALAAALGVLMFEWWIYNRRVML